MKMYGPVERPNTGFCSIIFPTLSGNLGILCLFVDQDVVVRLVQIDLYHEVLAAQCLSSLRSFEHLKPALEHKPVAWLEVCYQSFWAVRLWSCEV